MKTQMWIGSNPWALKYVSHERLLPALVWIDHYWNTSARAWRHGADHDRLIIGIDRYVSDLFIAMKHVVEYQNYGPSP